MHQSHPKRRWPRLAILFVAAVALVQLTGNGCWHPALRPVRDPQLYVVQSRLIETRLDRIWRYPTFQDSFRWGVSKVLCRYPDIKLVNPEGPVAANSVQATLLEERGDYVYVKIQFSDPAWPETQSLDVSMDVRLDRWGVVQGWVRPGTNQVLQLAVRINRPAG